MRRSLGGIIKMRDLYTAMELAGDFVIHYIDCIEH